MHRSFGTLGALLSLLVLLVGCGGLEPPGPKQPLVIGLPADPAFHQMAPVSEGMDGFTRDLVKAFAQGLGYEVSYVIAPNYPALLDLLRNGKVHMAAAVPDQGSDPAFTFSPPVLTTSQLIVQNAGSLPVDGQDKLAGREISVLPGALQIQTLNTMRIDPPPSLRERGGIDEIELLANVARGRYDLAATDQLHYDIAANFYPDIVAALELPNPLAYVWAFPAASRALQESAAAFIAKVRQDGTLRRLNDRYFGHIKRMGANDITVFLEHVRSRLPNYRHAFHEAQEITGIDWRLLAALAYQESKWDPLATSPTGVRGMMMLTEETADRLRVGNRLDAGESIRAGARYLETLMDDLPAEIKQPDRLWFALAAYNLGMGHLGGARYFAPGLKRDPNLWVDMKQVLPLMARPEYYERLKSGRARGGEAVIMVENIRNYFDVLSRLEPVYTPPSIAEAMPRKKAAKAKPAKRPRPKT